MTKFDIFLVSSVMALILIASFIAVDYMENLNASFY